MKEATVQILSDEKNKVTVARVSTTVWSDVLGGDVHGSAIGSARCMDPDTYDEGIGNKLALGRAFKALGERLEKEAFSLVHKRDRERERRTEATEALLERKKAYSWKFQCEFAELINLKLEEEATKAENDTIPEPRLQSTGSILRDAVEKSKKPRKKASQIREELPA